MVKNPLNLPEATKKAIAERATREAHLAVDRLKKLGLIPADKRENTEPVSLSLLFLAGVAARAELWEKAGHLPRLNPAIPPSIILDEFLRLKAIADRLNLPDPDAVLEKNRLQNIAFLSSKSLLGTWYETMAHRPPADNPDADFELIQATLEPPLSEPGDHDQLLNSMKDELVSQIADFLYGVAAAERNTDKMGDIV